jgi:hypothetical protein
MALGGTSPLIVFNFFKAIDTPNFLKGFVTQKRLPLLPIPVYLDEKLLGLPLDDYNRVITCDVIRDNGTTFEKVSGDVVTLKFQANKNNISVTAITALFDRIVKVVEKKNYSISIFYDNIIILDAALEQFQTNLTNGTTLREISITVSNRPPAKEEAGIAPLVRIGNSSGIAN